MREDTSRGINSLHALLRLFTNIPRYVDTFEEEEPIDIKAVMAEIKELEAKRAELDKEIEVYLKELGLVE